MGLFGWIDRKIVEAQTCPGCGCHPDTTGYRPGCDCLRQGCVCAGAEDDDTGGWERDPGPDAAIVDAAGGAALPPAAEPYTPAERPDLHERRRGRWYDEKPITTTNQQEEPWPASKRSAQ